MQTKINLKFNKKILCILILFIVIYIAFSLCSKTSIKSYATTYTYNSTTNELPANFNTTYPGYKSLLDSLKTAHPNWSFKLIETNLDWETVIINEYQGHGSSPKNLVPAGDSRYSGAWICPICGTRGYDTGYWYCASMEAIKYMMDPRNSLNETDLFQFQDLSSANGDRKAIENMVAGTFINNTECIDAILEAATKYNVSPYHLVSRIIQEQGNNGSSLGLGITADDGITYYNLFNVGAAGNTQATVIANGFSTAKSKGWTSMKLAIIGGSEFVAKNYIAVGQSTLYFQKFNVVNTNSLYGHQYMQNILAAQNEGTKIRSKYISYGILDSSYTFLIPIYKNMPQTACERPSVTNLTQEGELVTVNAEGGLALRDSPDGTRLGYVLKGEQIIRLEKATQKVGDYYWDKVSTSKGIGYMARGEKDESKLWLVPVNPEIPETNPDVTTNNNYNEPDENGIIITEPNTTVNKLKGTYTTAIIKDKDGNEITGDTLIGTGAKVIIGEVEKFTIIKLGDVNGDGKVNSGDLLRTQKHLLKVISLNDTPYLISADANKDGIINSGDLLKIQKHLLKVSQLEI